MSFPSVPDKFRFGSSYPHRSLTCGTSLPARQLHGTGELRKPRHRCGPM